MIPRVVAIILLTGALAFAHRLDEYLQGTILSVEKNRIQAQMTLTPGVAVFPQLMREVDTNADGTVSDAEQKAYAQRVLHDLSLAIDGHPLTPRLDSLQFPSVTEMKEGQGEILLEFSADLPPGGRSRKLTLENRHEKRISAYQVNCLVPHDPQIRIASQKRNESQSFYELDYENANAGSHRLAWVSPIALLLPLLALLWKQRGRPRVAIE